ncbi:MAG TPA: cytochrome c [Caulobacteraceae bacterium]|nr:cytochrome c [Caulobacteraceae bacterium]
MTSSTTAHPIRRRRRRLQALLAFAAIAAAGLAVFWIVTSPRTISAADLGPHTPNLDNGRTMFFAGDCAGCHAVPRQSDSNRLGGGLALVSKFGTFYAPNISSDAHDGIGGWTEAQFVTAMKYGVAPGGEHLYPIFPYASFQRMSTGDMRDLFAYLKTLPAVSGRAPDAKLAFPYNIRRLMGGWKLLYLDGKTFTPDPTKSAAWNRGAYLVNGPAHCAECHSPRNVFGAIEANKRFAGNHNDFGVLGFPNITQAGLDAWTDDAIAEMLRSGFTPDSDRVGGPMTEVVRSTSQLSDDDRAAIGVYIKSLPPIAQPAAGSPAARE